MLKKQNFKNEIVKNINDPKKRGALILTIIFGIVIIVLWVLSFIIPGFSITPTSQYFSKQDGASESKPRPSFVDSVVSLVSKEKQGITEDGMVSEIIQEKSQNILQLN